MMSTDGPQPQGCCPLLTSTAAGKKIKQTIEAADAAAAKNRFIKWLLFQLFSACIAVVVLLAVVPSFVRWLKPQRELEQAARAINSTTPYTSTFWNPLEYLPNKTQPGPVSYEAKLETQKKFWSIGIQRYEAESRNIDSEWYIKRGAVDLVLEAKSLDPGNKQMELVLTGNPYGYLSSRLSQDVLAIYTYSDLYVDGMTEVMKCDRVEASTPACADMVVNIGKSRTKFASGQTFGLSTIISDVSSSAELDAYPFDEYTLSGLVEVSILWFIREDGSVNNSKLLPDIYHYYSSVAARLELLPAISGWKAYDARVEPFERVSAFIDERYVYNASDTTTTFNVLRYEVKYCRSAFVRMFTIMIMVFMWIMSIFLLALSLDHVLIRPRSLEPDTVGYSVGMLFALPTLRMLLDAPLGSYVDYWSFAWNLVLVAVAVVIFFSGSYADHQHDQRYFKKYEAPQEVKVVEMPEVSQRLLDTLSGKLPRVATTGSAASGDDTHANDTDAREPLV